MLVLRFGIYTPAPMRWDCVKLDHIDIDNMLYIIITFSYGIKTFFIIIFSAVSQQTDCNASVMFCTNYL